MTKATLVKNLGTVFSLVLSGVALYFRSNPQLAAALVLVATNLINALHIVPPGAIRVSDLVAPAEDPLKP